MKDHTIILSQGSIPWLNLNKAITYTTKLGLDGIELVPFKWVISDLRKLKINHKSSKFKYIKSIHQNWRLDIGHNKEFGIYFPQNFLFNIIRLLLFPSTNISSRHIESLNRIYKLPVTVHGTSAEWTQGATGKEFSHGILYEIIGRKKSKEEIKVWLKNSNHSIVVDTRDDQSLSWAINQGFSSWQEFWKWVGTKKISAVQLTLIGTNGLNNILNHKPSLAEEQLLWLNSKKWKGTVTIEINPLLLLWNRGRGFKKGLAEILGFVKHTLVEGRRWS